MARTRDRPPFGKTLRRSWVADSFEEPTPGGFTHRSVRTRAEVDSRSPEPLRPDLQEAHLRRFRVKRLPSPSGTDVAPVKAGYKK